VLVSRELLRELTAAATQRVETDKTKMRDRKATIERVLRLGTPLGNESSSAVHAQTSLAERARMALEDLQKADAFDAALALSVLDHHRRVLERVATVRDWAGMAAVAAELIETGLATACGAEIVKTLHDLIDISRARHEQAMGASELFDFIDKLRPLYVDWCLRVKCQILLLRSEHKGSDQARIPDRASEEVLALYEMLWRMGQGVLH
jgi:hypothetical protein